MVEKADIREIQFDFIVFLISEILRIKNITIPIPIVYGNCILPKKERNHPSRKRTIKGLQIPDINTAGPAFLNKSFFKKIPNMKGIRIIGQNNQTPTTNSIIHIVNPIIGKRINPNEKKKNGEICSFAYLLLQSCLFKKIFSRSFRFSSNSFLD
ncbi:MAG: hypothetical protein ACKO7P_16085, partial [Bacteroidota bacterium]